MADQTLTDAAEQMPTIEEAIALYRTADRLRADARDLIDRGVPEGQTMGDLRDLVSTVLLEAGATSLQAFAAVAIISGAYPIRTVTGIADYLTELAGRSS